MNYNLPFTLTEVGVDFTLPLELFEDLSVRDNLLVAAHPTSWYTLLLDVLRMRQSNDEIEKRIQWALEVAGLTGLEEELPTDLPHGQRKLVA
mgnify:CR=1 FL=1